MADETTTTEAPAPKAPAAKAPAPAAAPQEATAPAEQMVSLAALREAHQERDAALHELAAARAAVQSLTDERDQAVTGLRRASVRMATGIDDDEIADMAHRRWASAMDGVEPDARLDVGAWWSQTASSDDARAALPKALRVYLPTVEQEAPATASAPAARPRIGTPSNRSRRAPAPGSTGEITPADLQQMSSEQAASLRANFWKSAGVT